MESSLSSTKKSANIEHNDSDKSNIIIPNNILLALLERIFDKNLYNNNTLTGFNSPLRNNVALMSRNVCDTLSYSFNDISLNPNDDFTNYVCLKSSDIITNQPNNINDNLYCEPIINHITELQPKQNENQNVNDIMNVEASIKPLTLEEERFFFYTLGQIDTINFIDENIEKLLNLEHNKCNKIFICCPFFFTGCYWCETLLSIAKHIRQMHTDKLMCQNRTKYVIILEDVIAAKDIGVKFVQQYNNRLYTISVYHIESSIMVTIQYLCESLIEHSEIIFSSLVLKYQNKSYKTWRGRVYSMHIPPSNLWKPGTALSLSLENLQLTYNHAFELFVDVST